MSRSVYKELLCQSPVLIYPDPGREFIVDTNVSHLAIGAVLSQMLDRKERPVAYFSRTLNQPEQQYCITRKYNTYCKTPRHFV